ncbi:MAG: thioredoxin domain-containing protein [Thiobacillus sp.]
MFGFRSRIGLLLFAFTLPASAALTNQLKNHPSPYLAQHGADPVAWQEWNTDTVARARRENKLLFVSVGYFACHWCHVMQRESYNNPQIAARLNRDFIPVKVDRELNSGLDEALQQFSSRLNGVAGWPLNALVTPEGYPAFVVLYAPAAEFGSLIDRLSARWRADDRSIRQLARSAAPPPALKPVAEAVNGARAEKAMAGFLASVWQEADLLHGGFGTVSKFPMAPQLDTLLARQASNPDPRLAEFLRLSFDQIAARGLRDHVGGGFFRYTVDPGWETPHFEKMLYDNAHLAGLYGRAASVLRQPRYRDIARSTLDFMRDTLADASGGFYTSTSAVDASGREGASYLWEPEELQRHLSPETYAAVRRVWRLDAPRNFEAGYLPAENRPPTQAERQLLDEAVRVLRPLRRARSLPVDNKLNAGLNGLALSAFSRSLALDPGYRKTADRLQDFLLKRMVQGGRLVKSRARGQVFPDAELEDYAYVVQGLVDHADATGNAESRAQAIRLARVAWRDFWNERGWLREARPLLATVAPEPALADGALYSPSAVLIGASLRLGDAELSQRARASLAWRIPAMAADPYMFPTQTRLLAQP